MKKLIAIIITVIFINCSVDVFNSDIDTSPPAAPRNVFSITGDNEVIVAWDDNFDEDLNYYIVYKSRYEDGPYREIGVTYDVYFVANIPNGLTYYFAVTAVDFSGNESELSRELVWDTPRPEGYNAYCWALIQIEEDEFLNFNRCGIDFSDYYSDMTQNFDNSSNDIFFDLVDNQVYLNAFNVDDTDIYMYGQTEFLSDVDFVYEDTEWDENGYLPVIEDYSYIIWTWDNHFVTIRIEEVYDDLVTFSWAYQTEQGNPQLKQMSLNDSSDNSVRISKPPMKK